MTNEEMNRAISESIEPMPVQVFLEGPTASGAWVAVWHGYTQRWSMEHRSWHTDETASAMLLERMPDWKLECRTIGITSNTQTHWWKEYRIGIEPWQKDRKTAIRNAYYAWSKR